MQFQEIVSQADELPFCFGVMETTEKKLSEPSRARSCNVNQLRGTWVKGVASSMGTEATSERNPGDAISGRGDASPARATGNGVACAESTAHDDKGRYPGLQKHPSPLPVNCPPTTTSHQSAETPLSVAGSVCQIYPVE